MDNSLAIARAISKLADSVVKGAQIIADEMAQHRTLNAAEIKGHELCLAIRAALFGSNASHTANIADAISHAAPDPNSLDGIAHAIKTLAHAIKQ